MPIQTCSELLQTICWIQHNLQKSHMRIDRHGISAATDIHEFCSTFFRRVENRSNFLECGDLYMTFNSFIPCSSYGYQAVPAPLAMLAHADSWMLHLEIQHALGGASFRQQREAVLR